MSIDKLLDELIKSDIINKLKKWHNNFESQKKIILNNLLKSYPTRQQILNYFRFSNMKHHHKDFCRMFQKDQVCHPIEEDSLYCYACNCPFYNLNQSPYIQEDCIYIGSCDKESKKAQFIPYKAISNEGNHILILDCSNCHIPHTLHTTKKQLDIDLIHADS